MLHWEHSTCYGLAFLLEYVIWTLVDLSRISDQGGSDLSIIRLQMGSWALFYTSEWFDKSNSTNWGCSHTCGVQTSPPITQTQIFRLPTEVDFSRLGIRVKSGKTLSLVGSQARLFKDAIQPICDESKSYYIGPREQTEACHLRCLDINWKVCHTICLFSTLHYFCHFKIPTHIYFFNTNVCSSLFFKWWTASELYRPG